MRSVAGTAPLTLPLRGLARSMTFTVLPLILLLVVILSSGIGAMPIAPGQVLAIIAGKIGITLPWTFDEGQAGVLLAVRLPRVCLGILIGGGLAASGAAMQGLFRNPLADPGLIGVSSGAALGAISMIVLGETLFTGLPEVLESYLVPCAAFLGSLAITIAVYRISSGSGRRTVATMLLTGIAINAIAGAATGLLTFVATDAQLRSITFWSLGSLGAGTWEAVGAVTPFILVALLLLPRQAHALNALTLGEEEAGHIGIDVNRVKKIVVVLTSLAVGASVAMAGIIGFIPLIAPHLIRFLIGPDHRYLIGGSALAGAILLIGADLAARTIAAPAELPIGIVTAALGAPFFLWLLMREQRGGLG